MVTFFPCRAVPCLAVPCRALLAAGCRGLLNVTIAFICYICSPSPHPCIPHPLDVGLLVVTRVVISSVAISSCSSFSFNAVPNGATPCDRLGPPGDTANSSNSAACPLWRPQFQVWWYFEVFLFPLNILRIGLLPWADLDVTLLMWWVQDLFCSFCCETPGRHDRQVDSHLVPQTFFLSCNAFS